MNGTLTTTEAARLLKRHPGTLAMWRVWGHGPKFQRRGRKVFYRVRDLNQWLLKHKN